MNFREALAIKVNKLLKERSMSRYALSKKAGIHYSTLKNILNRNDKSVSASLVVLIAYGFDMSVSEFLNDPLFDYKNLDLD